MLLVQTPPQLLNLKPQLNPLTSLIINAEMLEELDSEQALDSIAEIRRAARGIALVVRRLGGVSAPRSVTNETVHPILQSFLSND